MLLLEADLSGFEDFLRLLLVELELAACVLLTERSLPQLLRGAQRLIPVHFVFLPPHWRLLARLEGVLNLLDQLVIHPEIEPSVS